MKDFCYFLSDDEAFRYSREEDNIAQAVLDLRKDALLLLDTFEKNLDTRCESIRNILSNMGATNFNDPDLKYGFIRWESIKFKRGFAESLSLRDDIVTFAETFRGRLDEKDRADNLLEKIQSTFLRISERNKEYIAKLEFERLAKINAKIQKQKGKIKILLVVISILAAVIYFM